MTAALVLAVVGIGVLHLDGRRLTVWTALASLLFVCALVVAVVDQGGLA